MKNGKSKKSVAGGSVYSKRSARKDSKNFEQEPRTRPQRLDDLPPKAPPLEHEQDLRNYISRKKERLAHEKEKEVEQAEKRAKQMKELQKQQGANPATRKGADEEAINKRLAQGAFAFDSNGKPMLVKKNNPSKLPGILTQASIGIDG